MGAGGFYFISYLLEQGPDRVKACKLDNYNVFNKELKFLTVESPPTETVRDAPNKVEGE